MKNKVAKTLFWWQKWNADDSFTHFIFHGSKLDLSHSTRVGKTVVSSFFIDPKNKVRRTWQKYWNTRRFQVWYLFLLWYNENFKGSHSVVSAICCTRPSLVLNREKPMHCGLCKVFVVAADHHITKVNEMNWIKVYFCNKDQMWQMNL